MQIRDIFFANTRQISWANLMQILSESLANHAHTSAKPKQMPGRSQVFSNFKQKSDISQPKLRKMSSKSQTYPWQITGKSQANPG